MMLRKMYLIEIWCHFRYQFMKFRGVYETLVSKLETHGIYGYSAPI